MSAIKTAESRRKSRCVEVDIGLSLRIWVSSLAARGRSTDILQCVTEFSKLSGDVQRLVRLLAVTNDGRKLRSAQRQFADGDWVIQFDLRDDLSHLEMHVTDESRVEAYPVEMAASK